MRTSSSGVTVPMGDSSDMPQACFTTQPSRALAASSTSAPSGAAPGHINKREREREHAARARISSRESTFGTTRGGRRSICVDTTLKQQARLANSQGTS